MAGVASATSSRTTACILAVCVTAIAGSDVRPGGGTDHARLPVGLAAAVSRTVGVDRQRFAAARRNGVLVTRGGGLVTEFGAAGPVVRAADRQLSLRLAAVGRGRRLTPVGTALPVEDANRVAYRRAGLEEWYLNGPFGLEQGFTVQHRPPGFGALTIAVRTLGPLPARTNTGVVFAGRTGPALARYGGLSAIDAAGRPLTTNLQVAGRTLLLHVDDAAARYPLTIDPLIQQGDKLTGAGASGAPLFGFGVALSADGNTALIGGPTDDSRKGAAWIFTRSGSTWSQDGDKLTGPDESGNAEFGASVALSGDGKTALIGGPYNANGAGAAWVFVRAGSFWHQQGVRRKDGSLGKLTGGGEAGNGLFGWDVALADDGNTALIGGPGDSVGGAAWVFTRSGDRWFQQGAKLTGTGEVGPGQFGISVALAARADTALVGGNRDDGTRGAAWVFTRSGTAWSQQGPKLTGGGEAGTGFFGGSVALAADGSTALIGGPIDAGSTGAAWAFVRSGPTWAPQGAKLTGGGETAGGQFGFSVALAADGSTAVIGGPNDSNLNGAAWVFTLAGATWAQQGAKLTSGDATVGSLGVSVALAAAATTALIGASNDTGAALVFSTAPPVVAAVNPGTGPAAGGTTVTITGANLFGATTVKFGSRAVTPVKVATDSVSVVSPAGAGTVDVTVTTPNGSSATSGAARFTYTVPATTTATTTAAPATTAAATTTAAPNPIVARIVFATALRHGKLRILHLRIRVSVNGSARLRLVRRGVVKLQKTFRVKGGTNDLKAPIPTRIGKGVYQLQITLGDGRGHTRTYKTTVRVPA